MEDNNSNESTTTTTNLKEEEKPINNSSVIADKTPGNGAIFAGHGKQTYFALGSEDTGKMEIDLVTFREKGAETRYISIMFSGMNIKEDPPTPQNAFFNIENREEFNLFKAFVANLSWDD